ncbi:hypothetical protein TeGR_g3304, partial [Tetraparma gracilis]
VDDFEFGVHYADADKLYKFETDEVDQMPKTEYNPQH